MTVSRHRRRISTTWTAVLALTGVVVAAVLGVIGGLAIYNTKDGQAQGNGRAELTFPDTPTGLLAVIDGAGNLGSVAVFAGRPPNDDGDSSGGTILPVPVSADSSGGFGTERAPLNETVALFGIDSLNDEVSILLGMTIDAVTVLDTAQLTALLAPLGEASVTLPTAVTDARGTLVADAGPQSMDAATMAAVLAAADPTVAGSTRDQTSTAVWAGIAAAIGDGLGTPPAITATPAAPTTTVATTAGRSAAALLSDLTAGPVVVRELRATPIMSVDLNPRAVDAVVLDRADVVTVLGHIAPGRVSAPNAGANVQIFSNFAEGQLPAGVTRFSVAYTATKTLLAADDNVLAVDTSAGEADAATIVEVTDESLVAGAQSLSDVFGPVDVRVAEHPVAGVDVIVTLGADYLATLNTAAAAPTTTAAAPNGSVPSASDGTVVVDGTA